TGRRQRRTAHDVAHRADSPKMWLRRRPAHPFPPAISAMSGGMDCSSRCAGTPDIGGPANGLADIWIVPHVARTRREREDHMDDDRATAPSRSRMIGWQGRWRELWQVPVLVVSVALIIAGFWQARRNAP